MNYLKLFIYLFIFFFISSVQAQEPFFRQLQVTASSANLKINSICQDSRKIIWLGTTEGIYEYNGYGFDKLELLKSIENENITFIAPIPNKGIIAGTKSGKLFTVLNDKIELFPTGEFSIKSAISGICFSGTNEIWVSTLGDGIYCFLNNKVDHYTTLDGLGDDYVYTILSDSSGRIWCGSDRGLSLSRIHSGKISFRNFDASDGLPDNIIRQLTNGPGHTIGVGMEEKGFCVFNTDLLTFTYPDALKTWKYGSVNSLMVLENEFWIGTAKSGIIDYEFKGYKRVRQFAKNEGFDGVNLSCMLKDHEGNIWIGAGNELYLSPGESIEFKKTLEGVALNNIRTILCDKYDNIWFTNDSGLYCYNKSKLPGTRLSKPLKGTKFDQLGIISMYEDSYGFIWMGTFDFGVLRFNPLNGYSKLFSEKEGIINSNVLSIDGDGATVWFATLGGVSKCTLMDSTISGITGFVNFNEQQGLGNNFIYKVYIDYLKRVWFATDGNGITCFENGKFTNYSEDQGLKSRIIYSLTEDHFGNIWCSSASDGIYRFDGKSFRNFSVAQGLSDINISALITDESGNILVINNKGIDAIDPRNFQIITYGEEVGVTNIDPDVNVTSADQNGNVWMGTQKGIIKVSLEQMVGDKKPTLILNKVLCFLENVDTLVTKKFAYHRNHISFDFCAIWYTDPQKVSYQYKLIGYSNEWITTRDRFITFPNLRPGSYSFNLRTSINGNFSNSDATSFSFLIASPFWQQPWFIALSVLTFITSLYFYLTYRDRRAKSIELLKKEKIESQFEILKNQVNPHFLFNSFNTLITVIEDDKDIAVEYVNKLSDFFRNILAYREKDLITIKEELELVEAYVFLQKKRYGTNFSVHIELPTEIKESFLIPPLSLQIVLENCFKHNAVSKETPLLVEIFLENNTYLVIKNNLNPKLVNEPSTGIGLQNLKNRYMLMAKTDLVIKQTSTHFSVMLPLIKL
ncbi:MAG: histidine kinase [Bacteroidetes bacterium]|nr:histidine kinase [Bacteroidota bacterium]